MRISIYTSYYPNLLVVDHNLQKAGTLAVAYQKVLLQIVLQLDHQIDLASCVA